MAADEVVREHLAARYLGDAPARLPEFDLGEAGNAFRQEVRGWLARNWPKERKEAYEARKSMRDYDEAFAREVRQNRMGWPLHGRRNSAPRAFDVRVARLHGGDDPSGNPAAGAPVQAVSWMIYGTPDNKTVPSRIRRGEVIYGMWYSEPNSGSDLAP